MLNCLSKLWSEPLVRSWLLLYECIIERVQDKAAHVTRNIASQQGRGAQIGNLRTQQEA